MRMYHIVMYNLSPIQKGIQAGHAALEYVEEHGEKEDYRDFIENHKTWIILDGGGSEQIKEARRDLDAMLIDHSHFIEPDLNNAMSCVTFLVPEKIYRRDPPVLERSNKRGDDLEISYMNSSEPCLSYADILTQEEQHFKDWLNKFSLAR